MFARPKRLSRASFGPVAAGKRLVSGHFSVSYAPSPAGRAATVVSKKVAAKATARNELKRQMRAVSLPFLVPGRAFIVYARKGSPSLTRAQLRQELAELLSRLPSSA